MALSFSLNNDFISTTTTTKAIDTEPLTGGHTFNLKETKHDASKIEWADSHKHIGIIKRRSISVLEDQPKKIPAIKQQTENTQPKSSQSESSQSKSSQSKDSKHIRPAFARHVGLEHVLWAPRKVCGKKSRIEAAKQEEHHKVDKAEEELQMGLLDFSPFIDDDGNSEADAEPESELMLFWEEDLFIMTSDDEDTDKLALKLNFDGVESE